MAQGQEHRGNLWVPCAGLQKQCVRSCWHPHQRKHHQSHTEREEIEFFPIRTLIPGRISECLVNHKLPVTNSSVSCCVEVLVLKKERLQCCDMKT